MKGAAPGVAGRGLVYTQQHALCLLPLCKTRKFGGPFQFAESTDHSWIHSKAQIQCQEVLKHKIPCCANSLCAHALNTVCDSLLKKKRAKTNREKHQGRWEEWRIFRQRGRVGSLSVYLQLLRALNKVIRRFKRNRGSPGFHQSLCHTLLSKENKIICGIS